MSEARLQLLSRSARRDQATLRSCSWRSLAAPNLEKNKQKGRNAIDLGAPLHCCNVNAQVLHDLLRTPATEGAGAASLSHALLAKPAGDIGALSPAVSEHIVFFFAMRQILDVKVRIDLDKSSVGSAECQCLERASVIEVDHVLPQQEVSSSVFPTQCAF